MKKKLPEIKMAMTQNFVWIATEGDGDYLKKKVIVNCNPPLADNPDLEEFEVASFIGYHGYTLSFRSKKIYDEYRVFDGEDLIIQTEDVVVECPYGYTPTTHTSVYAFERDGNNLTLKGVGEWGLTIPQRVWRPKNVELSVVVPLYKGELFMCRTIDSILSSTLDDIELILIDDGSPDKSYEIAKRYEEHYGCVRAIRQENQGVSVTRNRGLELCTGKYMAFCDGDDIVHPFMYELLYNTCEKEGVDVAIAQTLIRKDWGESEFYLKCSARKEDVVVYDFDEMYQNRGTTGNIFFVAVWNKIVRTEVAKKAQFPTGYTGPGVLYEDVAYTGSLYSYIDRFAFVRDAYYTWDKRKQKTVGTASTWHKSEDNEYVWKMFIYGFSYMLYNKSGKHLEWHDFTHFKRLIESYDKFDRPSPLRTYWDEKLKELVNSQKLYDNKLIMADKHLKEVVERVR